MKAPVNVFFLGKGGVGKSTSSALYAVTLANRGQKVALASMDPAHNLSDIFGRRLSDRPERMGGGLSVMEVDQDKWIRTYLKDISRQIKRTYTYLTAFNLDHYFDLIRYSPGLEEYALVLAFQHIRRSLDSHDYLIFDMPPTALSLRFFSLPLLSLKWADKLQALRRSIIKKRELITKIKLLKKEVETDKVINSIGAQQSDYDSLRSLFEDGEATRIKLVLNPDTLSFAESERIRDHLQKIHIRLDRILLNKAQDTASTARLNETFPGVDIERIPWSEHPLHGFETLQSFLADHPTLFDHD